MRFILRVLFVVILVFPAVAQNIDMSELDRAARSAKGESVLFRSKANDQAAQREAEKRRQLEEQREAEAQRPRAPRPPNLFGQELKIFAEVNGEIITSRDMQDRVNAFVATTQIPLTAQNKELILDKVLQAAVDEKIKMQEATKNGISISESDLNDGMKNFAKTNKLTMAQLRQMLKDTGVSEDVFRAQMKAEMAWSRLVMMKARREIQISESEIKTAVDMINKDKMKQKYLVSEIVISKKKAKHIQDLVDNLRADPRFELYAMQFSESPSARAGGSLGWVGLDQLAEPLAKALEKMKVGHVSEPISVGADLYILKLEKVYRPGIDKAPTTDEDEVKELLRSKKIEEMANKYIRDLRNKAVIERRA